MSEFAGEDPSVLYLVCGYLYNGPFFWEKQKLTFDSCLFLSSKCMSNTTGRNNWLVFLRPCQSAMCIV